MQLDYDELASDYIIREYIFSKMRKPAGCAQTMLYSIDYSLYLHKHLLFLSGI